MTDLATALTAVSAFAALLILLGAVVAAVVEHRAFLATPARVAAEHSDDTGPLPINFGDFAHRPTVGINGAGRPYIYRTESGIPPRPEAVVSALVLDTRPWEEGEDSSVDGLATQPLPPQPDLDEDVWERQLAAAVSGLPSNRRYVPRHRLADLAMAGDRP